MSTSTKLSANQKGLAPILIVILIAVALGGYLLYSNYSNNRTKINPLQPTTQATPVPSTIPVKKCAIYTKNGQKTTACATCGNGVCEPFETCTATNIQDGTLSLPECGRLYCGKDCQ